MLAGKREIEEGVAAIAATLRQRQGWLTPSDEDAGRVCDPLPLFAGQAVNRWNP